MKVCGGYAFLRKAFIYHTPHPHHPLLFHHLTMQVFGRLDELCVKRSWHIVDIFTHIAGGLNVVDRDGCFISRVRSDELWSTHVSPRPLLAVTYFLDVNLCACPKPQHLKGRASGDHRPPLDTLEQHFFSQTHTHTGQCLFILIKPHRDEVQIHASGLFAFLSFLFLSVPLSSYCFFFLPYGDVHMVKSHCIISACVFKVNCTSLKLTKHNFLLAEHKLLQALIIRSYSPATVHTSMHASFNTR